MALSKALIEKCKKALLEAKMDILNRVRNVRQDLSSSEDGKQGDEGDQTVRALAESEALSNNERLRTQLLEIKWRSPASRVALTEFAKR